MKASEKHQTKNTLFLQNRETEANHTGLPHHVFLAPVCLPSHCCLFCSLLEMQKFHMRSGFCVSFNCLVPINMMLFQSIPTAHHFQKANLAQLTQLSCIPLRLIMPFRISRQRTLVERTSHSLPSRSHVTMYVDFSSSRRKARPPWLKLTATLCWRCHSSLLNCFSFYGHPMVEALCTRLSQN